MNYINEVVRDRILEWIDKQRTNRSLFIAIDGRCAAGKTTLASELQKRIDCDVFHMDDFFLQPEMRTLQRLEEPGGNVDYERFLSEVLQPLKQQLLKQQLLKQQLLKLKSEQASEHLSEQDSEQASELSLSRRPDLSMDQRRKGTILLSYRPYSCRTQQLLAPIPVSSHPIYIIEGSYACHPALWEYCDLHIFLSCSAQEQQRRIKMRNGTEQLQQFQRKWIPLEERYFNAFSIGQRCELTFLTDV